jgi:hypothetical protein
MLLLFAILVAIGTALAASVKVFSLIPATMFAWGAAAVVAWLNAFSASQIFGSVFLCGICLQVGYLAGTFVFSYSDAAE